MSGHGTVSDDWRSFSAHAKGRWEVYFGTRRTQKLLEERYTVLGLSATLSRCHAEPGRVPYEQNPLIVVI